MNKKAIVLIMICLIMTACHSNNSITTFEDTIEEIDEGKFLVNCSDEVNRGKTGTINGIGYLCDIMIYNTTNLVDSKGESMQFEDFSIGDSVRIKLSKPQNIRERNRQFAANEIMLLDVK